MVLDWLIQSIHLFRMPAFFWISGYFFALTMSRGDSRVVLGRRLFRLLVPAIATWLTFNVAQEWVIAVAQPQGPGSRRSCTAACRSTTSGSWSTWSC